jgi:hypothetical protein
MSVMAACVFSAIDLVIRWRMWLQGRTADWE